MSDINQINEATQSFSASNQKVSKASQKDAFENVLNKAFDKTGAAEMADTSTHALKEIASKDLTFNSPVDIVTGKTDKLIQMLDMYSRKLEDPNVSLKSIAPVLEEIKSDAGQLLEQAKGLSSADEGLKKIAAETAVTAQTEYLKFQRGDYLS